MSRFWTAPVTAVGSSVTVDIPELYHFPHVYVAFKYYDAADVATRNEVAPSAGTIAVSGKVNGSGGFVAFPDSPVDCTDIADTANAGAPFVSVKATPSGITTATHYVMTVTGSEA